MGVFETSTHCSRTPITEKVGLMIQNLKQAQSVGKVASSAPSQRSNPFDFVVKQGRTFHRYREGKYPLPNDFREQERLDFQHYFMLILLGGKLHLAPIGENPQNVLDIGTGTGIWAVEFADRYPVRECHRHRSESNPARLRAEKLFLRNRRCRGRMAIH
jgi:hypothetical protein